ncbi:TetR/AcrR family transcriptional regulator [Streptomyces sp. SID8352]|uniref:TetR/AcrR family transcriptional regulator n=1 Tax=Streptomyces sp. SID8352 TaxID=2690338 RepID=UPI001370D349|nr:TetR/AcrR family transcriptional regulator [Streptomyces sp. SID8352]MYU26302.1 TetR family transcriptional regulator [Streptomyces sp. SID8352]
MTRRLPRSARRDAHDNRARILDAARAVFGEDGLGAPVREVARHAGVAPATLYRHFPTKRALIAEALTQQRRACHTAVRDALADPDPWHGFQSLIQRICELHAHSRDFADTAMTAFPEAADLTADRGGTVPAVTELARRARASGRLRPDFVVDDLVLMLMAHQGVLDAPPAARPAASRRFAAYVIEAFRAPSGTGAPASLPPVPDLRPSGSPGPS